MSRLLDWSGFPGPASFPKKSTPQKHIRYQKKRGFGAKNKNSIKINRNLYLVEDSLENLRQSCLNNKNIMDPIINCARNYATLGEIVHTMKSVFGEWQETAVI